MLIGFLPYGEMNMSNIDSIKDYRLSFSLDSMLNSRKRHVRNASRMRYTQTRHHRAHHLRLWTDYLRLGKAIYGLKKTIYGLKKTIYGFEVISAE